MRLFLAIQLSDEMKAALPVDTTSSCSYQLFGSVELDFGPGEATEYVRTLSTDDAISRVSYVRNGIRYTREVFASLADDVVICHLTASRKGALSFKARILEPWKGETKAFGNRIVHRNATGSCRNKKGGQVRFEGILAAKNDWGRVQAADGALTVSDADAVTLYLSVGSNFNRYDDLSGDPHARAETRLDAAWKRPYADARADHVRRYRAFADRCTLDLGPDPAPGRTTMKRLQDFITSCFRLLQFSLVCFILFLAFRNITVIFRNLCFNFIDIRADRADPISTNRLIDPLLLVSMHGWR